MIKRFKITKLFGFRNINIPFDSNIKILIGENGLGKTTILNSLYYVLNNKFDKLYEIDFDRIEILFYDENKIHFTKRELITYLRFKNKKGFRSLPREIIRNVDFETIKKFYDESYGLFDANESISLFSRIPKGFDRKVAKFLIENNIDKWAPTNIMIRDLKMLVEEPIFLKFANFKKIIESYKVDILYFPTYRRVEEDLKNLDQFHDKSKFENTLKIIDFDEDKTQNTNEDTLIHFGMEDVEKRIESVIEKISNSTIEGFSKVTGEILSQFLIGFEEIDEEKIAKLNIKTARIVLYRVGDNIPDSDKEAILELLESPKGLLEKKELTYFLFKLIDIYNEYEHLDDALKKFRDICNSYLVDKEIRYNETNVAIGVYRIGTQDYVELNKLSSGEKQIISLFSKIYLEFSKDYIILFDEPELSLSIEWQKQLLPDIISSDKCKFLLSVTHSPFIFKNDLDQHAVGMNSYIK